MDGHMQLSGAHEVTYNGQSLSLPHSLSLTCQPALGCLFCHHDQFHVGPCSPAVEADP